MVIFVSFAPKYTLQGSGLVQKEQKLWFFLSGALISEKEKNMMAGWKGMQPFSGIWPSELFCVLLFLVILWFISTVLLFNP